MSSLLGDDSAFKLHRAPRTAAPPNNNNNNNAKGNHKKKKPASGEDSFLRLLEEAEYEVKHDPYRGMLAATDAQPSPWKACRFGEAKNGGDEEEVQDYCGGLVESACSCSCPALTAWTTEAYQKKNRSRKRRRSDEVVFGQRPEDPSFKCPCDYNPFCLATLGGVMNEILLDRMKQVAASEGKPDSSQSREGSTVDADDDDEVLVIEKGSGDSRETENGWELDPTKENSIYSLQTREWLKNVRQSTWVNVEPIRSYLSNTLQGLTSVVSIDDCLKGLRKMNDALVFVNPLLNDMPAASTKDSMRLSIPPGIENLGATCYLNTQLQCLAQNTVFLDGIFSWRAVQKDDRMSSVLSLFQQLLANMKAGHRCTLNTLEFSNALGLDHYEQQDPNEFSRLLFERMHESFRESLGAADGGKEDGRKLAELLPHLFQGMTNYETTCLTCQSKSRTNEEFMDLNLPIVQPSDDSPRKAGQQSILEAFKAVDTDVQFCLDRYCREEILDGDNQYFCSNCICKRDAKREFTFQKLPPILNVQLSRYVFDMKKLMKKKLSDKVLLPLELSVEAKCKDRMAGSVRHRYILCAVMKHKGTSAYSGHYVAEAMDWHTGQWFEFNDEQVTLLRDGPSCSYDPCATGPSEKGKQTTASNGRRKAKSASLSGSQDAYNMYYVEESFLAQSVLDRLRKYGAMQVRSTIEDGGDQQQPALLDRLAISRSDFYSDLANMCIEDGKVASRLDKRKESIQKVMFRDILSLQDDRPPVWVDARVLLRFMSCKDQLEEVLDSKDRISLLGHRMYLCAHDPRGLHPRLARKGKLLPRSVYDAFVERLSTEQRSISGKEGNVDDLNDCVITPADNLLCKECCDEYRRELSDKLERLRTLKYLYGALDPKEGDLSVDRQPNESLENEEDSYAYIVSRKFVANLRTSVARLIKKANGADSGGRVGGENDIANGLESIAEGIDAFDPKDFAFDGSAQESGGEDTLDVRINTNVTCEHGICNPSTKRSIRYVSSRVWIALKSIFPSAIEHKQRRRKLDGIEYDEDFLRCPQCESDGQVTDYLRTRLTELAQHCSGPRFIYSPNPADFVRGELTASTPDQQYRILHKCDLIAFQRFLSAFKRKDGQKKVSEIPEDQVSNLLRSHVPKDLQVKFKCNEEPSQSDQSRIDLLTKMIRPVVCDKHRRPIRSAIFRNEVLGSSASPPLLSDHVCIVDETRYKIFMEFFSAIAVSLYPDNEKSLSAQMERSIQDDIHDAAELCSNWGIYDCHPTFRPALSMKTPFSERFIISSHSATMPCALDCATCGDKDCNESFKQWDALEAPSIDKESSSSLRTGSKEDVNLKASGSDANDAIAVDSDLDDWSGVKTFSLRVFEIEAGADLESTITSLSQCSEISSPEEESGIFLRRSSRRRKSRYPVGVVKEEETIQVGLHHNIAALRLFLLERCAKGSPFELNHVLKLVVTRPSQEEGAKVLDQEQDSSDGKHSSKRAPPKVMDLVFSLNEKTLSELCEKELGGKIDDAFSPQENIMLLREATGDDSSKEIPKDALMDFLIGLANTITEDRGNSKGKKGRSGKKTMEKGFSGTFLSSAASVGKTDSDASENASKEARSPLEKNTPKSVPVVTKDSFDAQSKGSGAAKEVFSTCLLSTGPNAKANSGKPKVMGSEVIEKSSNSDERSSNGHQREDAKPTDSRKSRRIEVTIVDDDDLSVNDKHNVFESKPSSTSARKQKSSQGTSLYDSMHKRTDSMLKMLESDEDDDVIFSGGLTPRGKKRSSGDSAVLGVQESPRCAEEQVETSNQAQNGDKRRRLASEQNSLAMELTQSLLKNPNVDQSNESSCWDAAEWAVKEYPHMSDISELADVAFAKYYQQSMGD